MAEESPPWARKRENEFGSGAPPRNLQGESFSYLNIKCTACPYRDMCPAKDIGDHGCGMRKSIYEHLFSKIEFKTDDPLTLNRLRLVTYYSTELQLLRNFGIELASEEINLFKATMQEFGKLYIDKKGDLVDPRNKTVIPWDADPELLKLKKEVEEARALKIENEMMRAELAKKKQEKKDGTAEQDSAVRIN